MWTNVDTGLLISLYIEDPDMSFLTYNVGSLFRSYVFHAPSLLFALSHHIAVGRAAA